MDVTGLHSGVNPASGTFSVGASGRLIEGGELGAPAREVTIASDLVSMLQAVERGRLRSALGARSAAASRRPPLLIGEMTVGGA